MREGGQAPLPPEWRRGGGAARAWSARYRPVFPANPYFFKIILVFWGGGGVLSKELRRPGEMRPAKGLAVWALRRRWEASPAEKRERFQLSSCSSELIMVYSKSVYEEITVMWL
jgi:hypothetical protein